MLQSQRRRVVCGVKRLFIMKNAASRKGLSQYGTPDAIRTHDLQSRSLTLYPTELRAHIQLIYYIGYLRLLQGETRKTKKYSKFAKKAVDILRTR